jgi:hypothetical protein
VNATVQARALLSAVPADPSGLAAQRAPGAPIPPLRIAGRLLSREHTAAALFDAYADEHGLPGITTDALFGIARTSAERLGPEGMAEAVEIFTSLDPVEFWEVADCRWLAYRLHLSFWYPHARTRPTTVGEAAAALCLSDWRRCAGADRSDPRALSLAIRQGAAHVPATVLMTLGAALTGECAGQGPQAPGWLRDRLLPDHARRRAAFTLVRTRPKVPTPVIVRPDSGGYALGATPPPGPGNLWARSIRAEW